ncbi:MAG: leucine--tRNA ligase [Sphingobacteriales bacterium]|nr:MAG: leucine--tRNA ligase [Sphingobacteriales bacterium]
MKYNYNAIEQKWKDYWVKHNVYQVDNSYDKPKYYVLDMFPYPSGAGLHVGHPLGYIATDIFSRFKKMKGFNVLHPMGFDAFGLPAEQYALETGQHPAVTTEKNIKRYVEQLDNIGFNYDWSREIQTSHPKYYKWTQWIFTRLFHSWYNPGLRKAEPIATLISLLATEGNVTIRRDEEAVFSAAAWNNFDEATKRAKLMQHRLAYLDHAEVWWCEALNTVLANDEVVNGVSERGGHPVEKKKMSQWFLRITDYADRLIEGLDTLEWSEAMKEMQRNWIGRSKGASLRFQVKDREQEIEVFTTRPDTVFGVDFMVLAPELDLIGNITAPEQQAEVTQYIQYVKSRSERERMAEKKISGCFTGAYARHPFSGRLIPIWISEYVLAGYGTGAIMAVPSGDDRDFAFAQHFDIAITNIFGDRFTGAAAYTEKEGTIENSDFISGMSIKEATKAIFEAIAAKNLGERKVNYRLRDAGFSRQRYWGEPFPVVYQNGIPYTIEEAAVNLKPEDQQLPVVLPHVDSYKPGPEGQGPLANIDSFVRIENAAGETLTRETNTMPGYAGSSWYFLRYMSPDDDAAFVDADACKYWQQVDLYVGGTEHAVGHLLYSRFWTKVLFDLGYLNFEEPFAKLLNQGMIQGSSRLVYRVEIETNSKLEDIHGHIVKQVSKTEGQNIGNDIEAFFKNKTSTPPLFVSKEVIENYNKGNRQDLIKKINHFFHEQEERLTIKNNFPTVVKLLNDTLTFTSLHVDVSLVDGVELDIEKFKQWRAEYANAQFILEGDTYICGVETEKMSKSKYNVVNPDDIVKEYGADTFRMYEMFLGPIEMSKPWDTKGIEGVHRFLKKFWRLFFDEQTGQNIVTEETPTAEELKALHKTIKKITEDIERFSFNTSVSQFMILTNELSELKCHKKAILGDAVKLLCPFAPHIAEELWHQLGHEGSVTTAVYPEFVASYIEESNKLYPVAINGKHRTNIEFPVHAEQAEIEPVVLANEVVIKWLEGKPHKKIIFVKGKMINVIV